jgi:hypothetical protein
MNLRFTDDAEGWASLREAIAPYPQLGVAIETSTGPAVERLLELGVVLYPMNPKAAERFRDRGSTELAEVRRPALPGPTLAQNPLENVANPHGLR